MSIKKGDRVRWRQWDRADSPSFLATVIWVQGPTASIKVDNAEGVRWVEEVEVRMLDKAEAP